MLRLWSDVVRDDLFSRVYSGRLSPADAKAWARDMRLGPLAAKPDPADFDPRREPYWSLSMTLAWIMTGDLNAVREAWDDWRQRGEEFRQKHWRTPGHPPESGWFLSRNPPANLTTMWGLEAEWGRERDC